MRCEFKLLPTLTPTYGMYRPGRTHTLVSWTDRNVDCDYSSAYVILKTSSPDLKGVGMTFTIGRGNDIVRPVYSCIHSSVRTTMNDRSGLGLSSNS